MIQMLPQATAPRQMPLLMRLQTYSMPITSELNTLSTPRPLDACAQASYFIEALVTLITDTHCTWDALAASQTGCGGHLLQPRHQFHLDFRQNQPDRALLMSLTQPF